MRVRNLDFAADFDGENFGGNEACHVLALVAPVTAVWAPSSNAVVPRSLVALGLFRLLFLLSAQDGPSCLLAVACLSFSLQSLLFF